MNTVSELQTLVLTGDYQVDSLLDGVSPWNFLLPHRNTLYYTFDTSPGSYIDDQTNASVSSFNTAQMDAARTILSYAGGLTGISFVEVASSAQADIHFGNSDISGANSSGLTAISFGYSFSGDTLLSLSADSIVWLDDVEFAAQNSAPEAGTHGYLTLLHEIGHVLGLGHPFNVPNPLPEGEDHTGNTVMSYNQQGAIKSTYQDFDLSALTWIYGNDGLAGDWGYNSIHGFSLSPGSEDLTPPTVTAFSPADNSLDIPTDIEIVITFSEPVQAGSGSILLKANGQIVESYTADASPQLVFSESELTISPTQPLAQSTSYSLEIATGSVEDTAGNPYAGTTSYNFTTAPAGDEVAPEILAASPADESENVATDTAIVITFSEDVQPGTGSIVLRANGEVVENYDANSSSRLFFSGSSLTVTPSSTLQNDTEYSLDFAPGNVEDLAGNPFSGTSSYNFTTIAAADTTPPGLIRVTPADGAGEVTPDSSFIFTFSETIQAGSGRALLQDGQGTTLSSWRPGIDSELIISGNRLTINPGFELEFDMDYRLVLEADAVQDEAGNSLVGLDNYNFSTRDEPDTTPPKVIALEPDDGELSVTVDTPIVLQFDEPIQAGNGDILLRTASGLIESFSSESSRLTFNGSSLTINPSQALVFNTTYFVDVAPGAIEDLSGNSLSSQLGYSFATEAVNHPPTGEVSFSGEIKPGQVLTAQNSLEDTDGIGDISYQWLLDNAPVGGATADTFVLDEDHVGSQISLRAQYTDGNGTLETAQSDNDWVLGNLDPVTASLIEMYITIAGRAPDAGGLGFWSAIAQGGNSLEYIAGEMWDSEDAKALYPRDLSTEETATTVYTNVLNRQPDEEGLTYWIGQWDNNGPVSTMLEMITAIKLYEGNLPEAIEAQQLFFDKTEVGGFLALTLGNDDLSLAQAAFDSLEEERSIQSALDFVSAELQALGQTAVEMDPGLG